MTYWWASQNKNYRTAIPNGTLWTRPRVNGAMPRERAALQEMLPDDIVFHYGRPHVRAVSRVITSATSWSRPADYPRGPRETRANDDGKLVRVDVVADGLSLHRDRVAELIKWGTPGPLTLAGIPREAYISQLTDVDADALLTELDMVIPNRTLPGRPHENWPQRTGLTDAQAIARIRREQGALRAFLLAGRESAPCAICARELPADILVAGHILPRADLDDEQRWDFESAAVLMCLLGCDALFEHGYVSIDRIGTVCRGRMTDNAALAGEISARLGTKSPAWKPATAPNFDKHYARNADTSGSIRG